MKRARFSSAKRIASSVAVLHACSAVTTSMRSGVRANRSNLDRQVQEAHALEAELRRELARLRDELVAGLDAVHVSRLARLQEQVVEDETR